MGCGKSKPDEGVRPLEKVQEHEKSITCMALSEDESLLVTASDDRTARMWSAKGSDTDCLGVFRGHTDYITCIAIYDTYVITGGADSTVRKWDMATCECMDVYEGHSSRIFRVVCTGSWIFSSSYDKTARCWRFDTADLDDDEDPCIRTFRGHEKAVLPLVYVPGVELEVDGVDLGDDEINPGDLLITGSADTTARSWSVESGTCIKVFKGHRGPISCLAADPDGQHLFTASMDKTVRTWDIQSGRCLRVFEGHEGGILALHLHKTMLYTASTDGTTRCWVIEFGDCTRIYRGHQHTVTCIRYVGGILFTGSGDMAVRAFDAKSGALRKTFLGHEAGVMSLAFVGDGHIYSGGSDGALLKWDVTGLVDLSKEPQAANPSRKDSQKMRMAELEAKLGEYIDLNASFGTNKKTLMKNLQTAKTSGAWA